MAVPAAGNFTHSLYIAASHDRDVHFEDAFDGEANVQPRRLKTCVKDDDDDDSTSAHQHYHLDDDHGAETSPGSRIHYCGISSWGRQDG